MVSAKKQRWIAGLALCWGCGPSTASVVPTAPGPPGAPSASSSSDAEGFAELWRSATHRDDQVCKYRRVACRISEKVPGFGQPGPTGVIQVASEKPAAAAVVISRAQDAVIHCLRPLLVGGQGVRYRVWVAPDGRVSKMMVAGASAGLAASCGSRLRRRAYPTFRCGYGFEVAAIGVPRL